MKPSKIGIAIVAGAVALGALLFYANVRNDKRPVQLLEAAPEWPVTPVTVDFTASIGDPFSRQIWEAVNAVNDAVGCTVLSTSGAEARIHILTSMDRAPCGGALAAPPTKLASTYFCPSRWDGDGMRLPPEVDIVVDKAGHIREAFLIIQHELGHALGLPDGSGDVMAPSVFEEDWKTTARPLPTLPVAGARAIARRYCERGLPDGGP